MSAGASVEALTVSLGAFRLSKIDFAVSRGEILVILGPNGSGKSVTLETIAGFHRPESGRVLIGGHDVTALPPERRNVGFVVQNFGLFPHLSVVQNITIARRQRKALSGTGPAPLLRDDPAALLDYFSIAHLAQRSPSDLSPGEKQRVALARALATAPALFLFDEPFSALDAETHEQLRGELKSYLRMLEIPAIFVSHDRSDAMALADKVVILRNGAIEQSGPVPEALQRPINSFVARFVGVENILSGLAGAMSNSLQTIAIGEWTLFAAAHSAPAASAVLLSIRAEDVAIYPAAHQSPTPDGANRFPGRITELQSRGPLVAITADCGFPLRAYLLKRQVHEMKLCSGSDVVVEIAPDAIHLMSG